MNMGRWGLGDDEDGNTDTVRNVEHLPGLLAEVEGHVPNTGRVASDAAVRPVRRIAEGAEVMTKPKVPKGLSKAIQAVRDSLSPSHLKALDGIVDEVLRYRPKARSKPAVQRKRRRTILQKQQAEKK